MVAAIVLAEPALQRRVAGHAAAGRERDLHQLARGENALDVLVADEHLGATRAAPGVAAHAGALNPQFRHVLFLQLAAKRNSSSGITSRGLLEFRFAGITCGGPAGEAGAVLVDTVGSRTTTGS